MKKIKLAIIALAILLVATTTSVNASFPVKNETRNEQTIANTGSQKADQNAAVAKVEKLSKEKVKPTDSKDLDEKWITLLLWFFLGGFAAHRWYKKKPVGWNILYIITLGGCGVWAIIDLINILTDNF